MKAGDVFFPEIPESQQTQIKILLKERKALLMKGYEAARRNMALMYMRSERSDLNLRMTQVGVGGWVSGWVGVRYKTSQSSRRCYNIYEHENQVFFSTHVHTCIISYTMCVCVLSSLILPTYYTPLYMLISVTVRRQTLNPTGVGHTGGK